MIFFFFLQKMRVSNATAISKDGIVSREITDPSLGYFLYTSKKEGFHSPFLQQEQEHKTRKKGTNLSLQRKNSHSRSCSFSKKGRKWNFT